MEHSLSDLLTRYLDQAREHAKSLEASADLTESIHDFRLSIRRLRSWLKICRQFQIVPFEEKKRKQLKALVDITNNARDLDVNVELLTEYAKELDLTSEVEIAAVLEKWDSEREGLHRVTALDVQKTFGETDPPLRELIESIRHYEEKYKLDLKLFLQGVMTQVGGDLDSQLEAIESLNDVDAIHRARLLAKILRYLGEPFAKNSEPFNAVVKELHGLQDVIGGLRDTQIFSQRLCKRRLSPVLKAICHRNESRMLMFFSSFEATCLKPHGSRFKNKITLLFATIPDQP